MASFPYLLPFRQSPPSRFLCSQCPYLKSRGVSHLKLGEWFTSSSQGRRLASMRTSYPSSSKQRLLCCCSLSCAPLPCFRPPPEVQAGRGGRERGWIQENVDRCCCCCSCRCCCFAAVALVLNAVLLPCCMQPGNRQPCFRDQSPADMS